MYKISAEKENECLKQENQLLFEMLVLGVVMVKEGFSEKMNWDLKGNIGVKWGESVSREPVLDKRNVIHMSLEAIVADTGRVALDEAGADGLG